MIKKNFDWRHTDRNGCKHQWNTQVKTASVFFDDEETFEVFYMFDCNNLLVKCKLCNDTFLAHILGDGSNGV